jgi:DnaJ-class molecular chaperone
MTPDEYEERPCDECGKRVEDCRCFECPTCRGSGTVNPLTAPQGHFCVGTTDCPTCDGFGEI